MTANATDRAGELPERLLIPMSHAELALAALVAEARACRCDGLAAGVDSLCSLLRQLRRGLPAWEQPARMTTAEAVQRIHGIYEVMNRDAGDEVAT